MERKSRAEKRSAAKEAIKPRKKVMHCKTIIVPDPNAEENKDVINAKENEDKGAPSRPSEHGLKNLPMELKRNFKLMRNLDDRAQTAMCSIKSLSNDFMEKITTDVLPMNENERKDRLKYIQCLFDKAREYSDDKVQLALQTYELVDNQIRRLDNDLARLECEIQEKISISIQSKVEEPVVKSGRKKSQDTKAARNRRLHEFSSDGDSNEQAVNVTNSDTLNNGNGKKKKKKQKVNQEIQKKKRKTGKKKNVEPDDADQESYHDNATHPNDVLDMPVDPNEPTYCLCHEVSYGEMIACDNPDCPIEWFHFACVGLTIKPNGNWFCPKCTQERKKK